MNSEDMEIHPAEFILVVSKFNYDVLRNGGVAESSITWLTSPCTVLNRRGKFPTL